MSGKRQRTTFAKNQRERARMDKAAAKRARRQARKEGSDADENVADSRDEAPTEPGDRDEPQAI